MRIICRTGLTDKTELIEIAFEEELCIVCKNEEEAERIYKKAKSMGFDISHPLTFEEFVRGEFLGVMIKGFVVDDVDLLIEYLARGVPVEVIFINVERKGIKKNTIWDPYLGEVKDFYDLFDVGLKKGRARNAGNT